MSSNYFGQFEIHQIGGSQPEIHVEFSDKQVASDFLAVQMSVYDRVHVVQYQLPDKFAFLAPAVEGRIMHNTYHTVTLLPQFLHSGKRQLDSLDFTQINFVVAFIKRSVRLGQNPPARTANNQVAEL